MTDIPLLALFWKAAGQLESLELWMCNDRSPVFFETLVDNTRACADDVQNIWCPRLATLTVYDHAEKLPFFVRARKSCGLPLRTLWIGNDHEYSDAVIEDMRSDVERLCIQ